LLCGLSRLLGGVTFGGAGGERAVGGTRRVPHSSYSISLCGLTKILCRLTELRCGPSRLLGGLTFGGAGGEWAVGGTHRVPRAVVLTKKQCRLSKTLCRLKTILCGLRRLLGGHNYYAD
jgi:hypothetical protein